MYIFSCDLSCRAKSCASGGTVPAHEFMNTVQFQNIPPVLSSSSEFLYNDFTCNSNFFLIVAQRFRTYQPSRWSSSVERPLNLGGSVCHQLRWVILIISLIELKEVNYARFCSPWNWRRNCLCFETKQRKGEIDKQLYVSLLKARWLKSKNIEHQIVLADLLLTVITKRFNRFCVFLGNDFCSLHPTKHSYCWVYTTKYVDSSNDCTARNEQLTSVFKNC